MSITAKDEVMKFLSHNVLYLRKKHNITKKDMAKIFGVGIKTLNKIEQGLLQPRLNVKVLIEIQEHFEIPLKFQVSKKFDV